MRVYINFGWLAGWLVEKVSVCLVGERVFFVGNWPWGSACN